MAILYLASTEQLDDGLNVALIPLLPAARQRRINNSPSEQVRRLNIAAGGLLLFAMREAGLPDAAEISLTEKGKPYFAEYPDFHFSLSHSGIWAACAVGGEELGVDIQKTVSVKRQMQERCLYDAERVWLDSLPDTERDAAFCRLWSLKEALLKAKGCGLSIRPDQVQVTDAQGRISCDGFHFREFSLSGYAVAVCCRQESIEPQARSVDLRSLLRIG